MYFMKDAFVGNIRGGLLAYLRGRAVLRYVSIMIRTFFIERLFCARRCAKHCTCIITHEPFAHLSRQTLLSTPFQRQGNGSQGHPVRRWQILALNPANLPRPLALKFEAPRITKQPCGLCMAALLAREAIINDPQNLRSKG